MNENGRGEKMEQRVKMYYYYYLPKQDNVIEKVNIQHLVGESHKSG